jgi:hypothetical protein
MSDKPVKPPPTPQRDLDDRKSPPGRPLTLRTVLLCLSALIVAVLGYSRLSASIGTFERTRSALGGSDSAASHLGYGGWRVDENYARAWREQTITKEERQARDAAARPIILREPQTIRLRPE